MKMIVGKYLILLSGGPVATPTCVVAFLLQVMVVWSLVMNPLQVSCVIWPHQVTCLLVGLIGNSNAKEIVDLASCKIQLHWTLLVVWF